MGAEARCPYEEKELADKQRYAASRSSVGQLCLLAESFHCSKDKEHPHCMQPPPCNKLSI